MTARTGWSRRSFVSSLSMAFAAIAGTNKVSATALTGQSADYGSESVSARPRLTGLGSTGNIYSELGITPVVNAAGTYTVLGGSLMAPEVFEVMRLGNDGFVDIRELEVAAGKKMEELCKMPPGYTGLVTAGAAAAILVGYAATLTGDKEEYIRQIPDLTGMPKSEVIIQKSHRYAFDHQIRQTGVKLVEVETREQLVSAINSRTAAMHFSNYLNEAGHIKVDEFAKLGQQHNIPTFNDASADAPPVSRLWEYTELGYDLVTFSGGKDIRGPQAAGLLMGKKDLIRCALLNMSPNEDTIGRASKVGKEEIVGLLKALEMFVQSDQQAVLRSYYEQLGHIATQLKSVPGVHTDYNYNPDEIANNTVRMSVSWDPAQISFTKDQVMKKLEDTRPMSIRLADDDDDKPKIGKGATFPTIQITAWMLKPGQDKLVANRLIEIFRAGGKRA